MKILLKVLWWTVAVAPALFALENKRLSPKDFAEAKKIAKGAFYLRVDAPCLYSQFGGLYGPGYTATGVAVASPVASNVDLDMAARLQASGATWILGPNDPVGNGKLYYTKAGDLEFDFEGLGASPKNQESIVTFSDINSLEDFKKAFDRVFSRVPLQDAHPEWPDEIRKAVAGRRLVAGMDRQQVHAVIGAPFVVETGKHEGSVVEKWQARPADVAAAGRRRKSRPTGFPPLVVFLDGRLTTAEAFYEPAQREALLRFGAPAAKSAKK